MNKTPFTLALIAGLYFGTAQAADGTLEFTGNIIDAGCTIDPADATQIVPMGDISKTAFTASGDVAAPTEFSIRLTACPATLLSANARFDGPTHPDNSNILALTGSATGVGIAIYEKDATTLIPIGTRSAAVSLATGNAGALEFIAKYMATTAPGGIVAGGASATSQFTISYN